MTRTPCSASSARNASASSLSPALLAVKADQRGTPCRPGAALTRTTWPLAARSAGSSRRVSSAAAIRLTDSTRCHRAAGESATVATGESPAQCTKADSSPTSPSSGPNARGRLWGCSRSAWTVRTPGRVRARSARRSGSRPSAATWRSRRRSSSTRAVPIPPVAPLTRTVGVGARMVGIVAERGVRLDGVFQPGKGPL